MEITNINIIGSEGFNLKNRFFSFGDDYKGLAIFLPGAGYTCDMPAMYYPRKVLLSEQYDALTVEYSFQSRGLMYNPKEMANSVLIDAENAVKTVLEEKSYDNFVLVGKSLSTPIISQILLNFHQLSNTKAIYLTPVLSKKFNIITSQVKQDSLMIIGTNDDFYKPELINELKKEKEFELMVLEGADHGLEIRNNCMKSIDILKDMCKGIKDFL